MKKDKLYELVRNAVLMEWDPIGINKIPQAQDEYDSYIPRVCKLLSDDRSKYKIFDYLWRLETEHMGLNGNRAKTEKFVDRLFEIYRDCSNED